MKHKTGEVAPSRGIYVSDCRDRSEHTIAQGKTFPPCPVCGKAVTWHFYRSVWGERPPPLPPYPHPPKPPGMPGV